MQILLISINFIFKLFSKDFINYYCGIHCSCKKLNEKITYISELCLPSNSGYAQHVLKICDSFSKKFETQLFVISNNNSFLKFKKEYILKEDSEFTLT